ncbi:MAG: hypothetical protein D3917_19940 [Candidatus Electrothrix sp. AX5]|nr:hypothetical protein [Candidatus Electrothrix sp. AX5]
MDIITTALTAALVAGAAQGANTVSKQAIVDSYNVLKNALSKKFGANDQPLQTLKALECNPSSETHQHALDEQITKDKISADHDIQHLAQVLFDKLSESADGRNVSICAVSRFLV